MSSCYDAMNEVPLERMPPEIAFKDSLKVEMFVNELYVGLNTGIPRCGRSRRGSSRPSPAAPAFCSRQRPAGHSHWTRRSRSPARPPPDTRQRPGRSVPGRSHRPDRSSVYQIPSGWKNQPPPGLPSHDIPISYTCPILFLPCAALHRAYYYSLNIIAYPPTNCNSPRPSKMPPCNTFGAVRGHKFFMKFLRYARMGSMAAASASF